MSRLRILALILGGLMVSGFVPARAEAYTPVHPSRLLVLTGGFGFTPAGDTIRITVHDPDGEGIYTGCAKTPVIENLGFTKPEGGDFVQREYKAYAETNSDGLITFHEFTEISTFTDTTA